MNHLKLPILTVLLFLLCAPGPRAQELDAAEGAVPQEYLEKVNPEPATKENLDKAKAVYDRKCAGCHGLTGDGKGRISERMGFHATAFNDSEGLKQFKDGELFYWIATGRDPMPAFERKLTESDRWLLVHYLRKLAEPPAEESAPKPES